LRPWGAGGVSGIKVGRVTDVKLMLDPKTFSVRIPVTFDIEPDRVLSAGQQAPPPYQEWLRWSIGACAAKLQSGTC